MNVKILKPVVLAKDPKSYEDLKKPLTYQAGDFITDISNKWLPTMKERTDLFSLILTQDEIDKLSGEESKEVENEPKVEETQDEIDKLSGYNLNQLKSIAKNNNIQYPNNITKVELLEVLKKA